MTLRLNGSTSGYVEIDAPAVAGSTSITLPATAGEVVVKATDGSVDLGSVDIDSSGRLLVGTSTSYNVGSPGSATLQAVATSTVPIGSFTRYTNDNDGAIISLGKSRGTSAGSFTVVQNGDIIGNIRFAGADGGDLETQAASIRCEVDGTPGANDMPGRLVFSTTADGASSPTERARIDSSGRLLVGTSTSVTGGSSAYAKLQVNGNTGGTAAVIATGSSKVCTSITNNEGVGYLIFTDNAAAQYAWIGCEADGVSSSSSDTPGRLIFATTPDGSGTVTERMRIDNAGVLNCPGVYNFTTASAANVVISSGGNFNRSTSSSKYKTDIETLQDSYADALLQCRPVWYRSTCKQDNPAWGYWGFIAEEVAEIDPRLVFWKTIEVTYNEKGSAVETPCDPEPEGVAYDRFVPHLLNLIKRQGEAIADLQAEVAALKAQ